MARCIQLAKNGLGTSYPNPLVGSVIVVDGKIISEGWHYKAGSPHAEVNAISGVAPDADLFKDATIYVSLEPCSHFGKTPPCADFIISKGIRKVVIGSLDPNPKVAGRGVLKLINAGCNVISGVLEDDCDELNKRFFTFHKLKRPYIFLKWAQTADGFVSPEKSTREGSRPVWITNEFSRQWVHKMRSEEMAILVGTNTALEDNPSLTVRDWAGNNPIRVIIDRKLKISPESSVMDGTVKTLVFNEKQSIKDSESNISFIQLDFSKEISIQMCEVLYEMGIQSLIVEGGQRTLQTFIDSNLWDEAVVFKGSSRFGKGLAAPKFIGEFISETLFKKDTMQHFKNRKS